MRAGCINNIQPFFFSSGVNFRPNSVRTENNRITFFKTVKAVAASYSSCCQFRRKLRIMYKRPQSCRVRFLAALAARHIHRALNSIAKAARLCHKHLHVTSLPAELLCLPLIYLSNPAKPLYLSQPAEKAPACRILPQPWATACRSA